MARTRAKVRIKYPPKLMDTVAELYEEELIKEVRKLMPEFKDFLQGELLETAEPYRAVYRGEIRKGWHYETRNRRYGVYIGFWNTAPHFATIDEGVSRHNETLARLRPWAKQKLKDTGRNFTSLDTAADLFARRVQKKLRREGIEARNLTERALDYAAVLADFAEQNVKDKL